MNLKVCISDNKPNLLPLKMLFLSYLNYNQTTTTISDCHSALARHLRNLSLSIDENYEQISQILNDSENDILQQQRRRKQSRVSLSKMMDVIEQEEYWMTERQCNSGEKCEKQKDQLKKTTKVDNIVQGFNKCIALVDKTGVKFQQLIFLYKNELKQIAQELTKQKSINHKLNQQLTQKHTSNNNNNKTVNNNNNNNNKSINNIKINKPSHVTPKQSSHHKPTVNKNLQNHPQSQDQQARQPPKPFCQQCTIRSQQAQQQKAKSLQQKNKWKLLSQQITNLKNTLSNYEQQLLTKQSEINQLNEQITQITQNQNKTETEDKKKLRTINTTLRGQKIMLENLVQSLRKNNQQLQDQLTTIQTENKRLKLQKDNLQSTIKWHENTITDLRKNFTIGVKEQGEIIKKCGQLQKEKQLLFQQVSQQQNYLEEFVQKLKEVDQHHQQTVKALEQRVQQCKQRICELESIVEQKNQTIVKLKIDQRQQNSSMVGNKLIQKDQRQKQKLIESISINQQKRQQHIYGTIMNKTLRKQNFAQNLGFQQNMIKVLNKKIIDKDQIIQKLQTQILQLREQLENI